MIWPLLRQLASDWSPEERDQVLEWFYAHLWEKLVHFAAAYFSTLDLHEVTILGYAEDLAQDALLEVVVQKTYDPNRYDSRLKNCWDELDLSQDPSWLKHLSPLTERVANRLAEKGCPLEERTASAWVVWPEQRWYVDDMRQDLCVIRQKRGGSDRLRIYRFGGPHKQPWFSVPAHSWPKGGKLSTELSEAFVEYEEPLDVNRATIHKKEANRWEISDGKWRYRMELVAGLFNIYPIAVTRKQPLAFSAAAVPHGAKMVAPKPGKQLIITDGEPTHVMFELRKLRRFFHYTQLRWVGLFSLDWQADIVADLNAGRMPLVVRQAFDHTAVNKRAVRLPSDQSVVVDVPDYRWYVDMEWAAFCLMTTQSRLVCYAFDPLEAYLYALVQYPAQALHRILDGEGPLPPDIATPGSERPDLATLVQRAQLARQVVLTNSQQIADAFWNDLRDAWAKLACGTELLYEALDLCIYQGLAREAAGIHSQKPCDALAMRQRLIKARRCLGVSSQELLDDAGRWRRVYNTLNGLLESMATLELSVQERGPLQVWVLKWEQLAEHVNKAVTPESRRETLAALETWLKQIVPAFKTYDDDQDEEDDKPPAQPPTGLDTPGGESPARPPAGRLAARQENEAMMAPLEMPHLTTAEMVLIVDAAEGDAVPVAFERHLDACPICRHAVAQMRETWQAFPEAAWQERRAAALKRIQQRTRAALERTGPVDPPPPRPWWKSLQEWLASIQPWLPIFSYEPTRGATREYTRDGEMPIFLTSGDERFLAAVEPVDPGEADKAALVISVFAPTLLLGSRLRLSGGDWERIIVFDAIDDQYARCRTRLTAQDMATLGGQQLRMELLDDESAAE